MISIEGFKQVLGKVASDMTEIEIRQLKEIEYHLAEMAFKIWLKKLLYK